MIKKHKTANSKASNSMVKLISDLFPICRSITGNGVRETLDLIGEHIPIRKSEIATGTKAFDWEIPKEWNISDAYIRNSNGETIVSFKELNLHVLNYSTPFNDKIDLKTLKEHIYTIPEKPNLIPYRTSYYAENWGFCMSHKQFLSLKEDTYEVNISSRLEDGSLTYGEAYFKGQTDKEVLISTHICHPSLCNDNLSGIAVNTLLAKYLKEIDHYYSYRFLFIPGTIGAIAWLSQNEDKLKFIEYGLVTSLLGLDGLFTYKRSRAGNERIDQIVEYVLKSEAVERNIIDFIPYGYDERQFCSPGINLPVGNMSRIPFGQYPEYHTSADDLSILSEKGLNASLVMIQKILRHIEIDRKYLNLLPKGEPQLGKRGLYDNLGGSNESKEFQMALLWILNFSDGEHSLFDIAVKSGIKVDILRIATSRLLESGILIEL